MCLTDTGKFECSSERQLARVLHLLMAEEHKAVAQYSQVIDSLDDDAKAIKTRLEEIHRDELNHLGVLLDCLGRLPTDDAEGIAEGVKENAT